MECWLRSNSRVMILGMILPAALLVTGALVGCGLLGGGTLVRGGGWGIGILATAILGLLIHTIRMPRVAYNNGYLLLYLKSFEPIRVPIEIVECFFLGQATSQLPTHRGEIVEARTLVIRLAESATEWHRREIKPALGHWCDGYVTIRGTWCEPLSVEQVNRLNRCLAEIHRLQKDKGLTS